MSGGSSGGSAGGGSSGDAGALTGESCDTAQPLIFDPSVDYGGLRARRAQVNASTLNALDDHFGTCGGSGVPELVYRLDLAVPSRLEASMVWSGVTANPALYLRANPCTPGLNQVACDTSTSTPPTSSTITVPQLAPGPYFLFADGRTAGARGPFVLTVDLYDGQDAGTCASPEPLVFNAGIARAEGNTRFLNSTFDAPCAAFPGGSEQVYRLDNPAQQDLTLTIASTADAPILALRQGSTCAGPHAACNNGYRLRQVVVPALAVGTYTLLVEASVFGGNAFALTATLGSFDAGALLPGDTCFNPEPLVLSNGGFGTASIASTTRGYFKDTGADACASEGADRIFTFDTTGTRTITATVSSASVGFMPTLIHRRTGCANATTGDRCAGSASDGGLPTLTLSAPAGRQYLVVDGEGWTSAGDFTLDVSVQ